MLVESLLQGLEFALAVYCGCVCAGGLLAGFIEIGVGVIERRLELLGAAAVLGGFGGGDIEERLEVGGGSGGGVGVLLELGFECGARSSAAVAAVLGLAGRVVP